MRDSRRPSPGILTIALSVLVGPCVRAQGVAMAPPGVVERTVAAALPDSPGFKIVAQTTPPVTDQVLPGSISGVVMDANGAAVNGALVVLQVRGGEERKTVTTTALGAFQFSGVESGPFEITITAAGFATWTSAQLLLEPEQVEEVPPITLRVASAVTNVEVTVTQHDIAEEQMQLQEMQRVLGFIPNFNVSYVWNAVPLSSGQKFHLALKTSIDPVTIGIAAGVAGVEQWQNDIKGYGQGAEGYAKRFGAAYANSFIDAMMGGAVFPSVLRQDPRYFYKGTGSIRSRALYAIAAVVICKGDNGHWQPNYSNVLGNLAAAGISNIYYPPEDRDGAALTIENSLIGTAEGAIGNLFQEFLVKKISRGVPPAAVQAAGKRP